MQLRRGIPGIAVLAILLACSNQPELNQDMTAKNKVIAAPEEKLGYSVEGTQGVFRIFAPAARQVSVVLFQKHDAVEGLPRPMTLKANGVWECRIDHAELTPYYAYRSSTAPGLLIADPYSRAVVRQNNFKYPSKTVILESEDFDWDGDDFTHTPMADLVILEAHLRDMTVHPSSGGAQAGSYPGFVAPQQQGGLTHLLDMGYNAVEFLPLQEFGNIEIDYKNPALATYNDWNPYETNHWGYMTSFFFAPEIYYASDGVNTRDLWLGQDGRAVRELKSMVKALHGQGISVIVDVVYNHVSQYDENPFKLLDKEVYFRLDASGNYLSTSGCGNDFRTEHPMARKLIVESLVYWMEAFHVDGFRFDLAAMIDLETVDAITSATRSVNPDVILIGEPWGGGGYNPDELADHDWASWNDHFRNSVKGRNPDSSDYGLIFGKLWDGHDLEHYQKLMRGYLQTEGGHYRNPGQSVNYLESHDDQTLGDFIRIALRKVGKAQKVNRQEVDRLSPQELQIHKFAAFNLLTSQGPVMIAQGQSWGRAKVIANSIETDPQAGELDHNSYEKDDETNWLNWDEKRLNADLVDYYRGLIRIRSEHEALRNAEPGYRKFFPGSHGLAYGIRMGSNEQLLVLINADLKQEAKFQLPAGEWTILADAESAVPAGKNLISRKTAVPPQSGLLLLKRG